MVQDTSLSPASPRARTKSFGIEGSGAVRLEGMEIDIVDTPEFQRLDGIRQLGSAHLVFRSANHTRFEHSLGTLHEAQGLIDAVNDNPRRLRAIEQPGAAFVRLTALLHDLTHVPYSHTLEDEVHLLGRHDQNEMRRQRLLLDGELGRVLRAGLADRRIEGRSGLEFLVDCLRATDEDAHEVLGSHAYIADIVNNTVCADALDYVPRDLRACGMPVAIGEHFKGYFVVTPADTTDPAHANRMALRLDKRGMPRPDVVSEVMSLLEHRYQLVERVFFHHGKNAASAMLARAVHVLGLHEHEENFIDLSDATLELALASPAVADTLGLRITDDPARWEESQRLGTALQRRRLYKLAFLGVAEDDVRGRAERIHQTWGLDPERRKALEDRLAALSGLGAGEAVIHVPAPRMLAKQGKVRVILEDGDVILLSDWDRKRSGRLLALQRAHEELWRVSVYVVPGASATAVRLVNAVSRDEFGLQSRYVRTPQSGSYLDQVYELQAEDRDWPIHLRVDAVAEAETMMASVEGDSRSDSLAAQIDLLDVAVRHEQDKERRMRSRREGQGELDVDDTV